MRLTEKEIIKITNNEIDAYNFEQANKAKFEVLPTLESTDEIVAEVDYDYTGTSITELIIVEDKGYIYTGVSLGFYCGIGSCGEYQAVGSMISNGEKEIETIVSVFYDEKKKKYEIIPPCGKCREMIHQLSRNNWDCEVIVSSSKKVKLKDLLPYAWEGTIEK